MNPNNFKVFQIELGVRFAEEKNSKDVDAIFRRLINLEEFDGVKRITSEEDDVYAKLTSSDSTLKLGIVPSEISLAYVNKKLEIETTPKFKQLKAIFNKAIKLLNDVEFDAMRTSITVYSTSISDRAYMISELVNEKYQSSLDEFDIWIENPGEEIEGIKTSYTVSVTSQHSTDMHRAFDKAGKHKALDNLISLQIASGILENVNNHTIAAYTAYAMSDKLTKRALAGFGYAEV